MKLKDEILQLVEKSGHNVNEIVAEAAERLEEISEAENKSDIGYVLKWLEEKSLKWREIVEESNKKPKERMLITLEEFFKI